MAFDPPIPCSWLPLLVSTMKIKSPIFGMWFYIMSFIQRLHSWLYVRGPQAIGEVRSGSSTSENSVCEYNHSVNFFNFFPILPRPKNEEVKGNTRDAEIVVKYFTVILFKHVNITSAFDTAERRNGALGPVRDPG